jgi:hypothetical protein
MSRSLNARSSIAFSSTGIAPASKFNAVLINGFFVIHVTFLQAHRIFKFFLVTIQRKKERELFCFLEPDLEDRSVFLTGLRPLSRWDACRGNHLL